MPELPEVETVARDLRPRILGATITGARVSWARTLRTHTPEAFDAAVAGRHGRGSRPARQARRRRPVRRCRADHPPEDDRPAVRRAGRDAGGSLRPARPRARRRPRGALPRHPQVRPDRPVRPRSGDGRARHRGRRDRRLRARSDRSRSIRRSTSATSGGAFGGGRAGSSRCCSTSRSSPASATSTPTRRCGRRELHPLRTRRRPSVPPTSATCTSRSGGSWARRSSGAAARSTTTPRPTATARCRSTCRSTSGPASRVRAAAGRSSGSSSGHGRPTSARGASGLAPADRKSAAAILRTMTGGPRRAGRRWTELAGEGTLGPDARRRPPAPRPRRGPTGRSVPRPPAARRHGRRSRRADQGSMSILRLTGVTREVGTFVILDAIDAAIALGDRIGLVGPNGAGKTTLLRLASGRDEPDLGEVHRKRGLTLGLLAQEAHFDEAFMASPDLRLAVRTGAAHLDRMAERLAVMERAGTVTEPRLCGAPAPVRDPRRLHARPAGRERPDRARLHPRGVGQAAVRTVRRRADTGVAGPPGHRRSRPPAPRRADQPPRPRRARMARGAPPAPQRVAARRVPRPRVPRRHGRPRLGAARPAPDGVPR